MKVLIAIDHSEFSSRAIEYVLKQAWPKGAEFLVLTVIEPIYAPFAALSPTDMCTSKALLDAEMDYAKDCSKHVESTVETLKKNLSAGKVNGKVAQGLSAADTILDEAKNYDADLIVLGSHGRRGFERFMLGSVASRVAANSPCSVEVVKAKVQKATSAA